MVRQKYLDYVARFSNLSPYELDHMSEMLYVQTEKFLYNNDRPEQLPYSVSDLKDIITKTMRSIYIQLANIKKNEFDQQIAALKQATFAAEELWDK